PHLGAGSARVVSTHDPDATANALSLGAGGVWFAGHARSQASAPLEAALLERIDPMTGTVDRRLETHTGASVVAVARGAVWSTGYLGGHIRGSARSDAAT